MRHINSWLSRSQEVKGYIASAPEPRKHEKETFTDEQRKANIQKLKNIAKGWTDKRRIT